MIVCVPKDFDTSELIEYNRDKYVLVNSIYKKLNFNSAVLLSDIGYIVLLKFEDEQELLEYINETKINPNINLFVIYTDAVNVTDSLTEALPTNVIIKRLDNNQTSLEFIISELYNTHIDLIEFKTSTHKFIRGLSRDGSRATIFSDNIVTITQELSEEQNFCLEIDIKTSEDLYQLLKEFVDESINLSNVFELDIYFTVSSKTLSEVHDYFYKLHAINNMLMNK
jgi:hypothetical protein